MAEQTHNMGSCSRLACRPRTAAACVLALCALAYLGFLALWAGDQNRAVWSTGRLMEHWHVPYRRSAGALQVRPGRWGCVPAAGQRFHVVISSLTGSVDAWLPWVRTLGLSNADVYLYMRQFHTSAFERARLQLPCGMRLHVRALSPNRGNEPAVYLAHILDHYDALPHGLLFAHEHGGRAWHTQCGPFFRRSRTFYLGLQQTGKQADARLAAFARHPITLSSGCAHNTFGQLQGCCATMMCGYHEGFCPKEQPCTNTSAFAGRRFPMAAYDAAQQSADFTDEPLLNPASLRAHASSLAKLVRIPPDKMNQPDGLGANASEEGIARCKQVLASFNVTRPSDYFWGCCNMFLAPAHSLAARPRQLYQDMFDVLISQDVTTYGTSRWCGEFTVWDVLGDNTLSAELLQLYMHVDDSFPDIVGCPTTTTFT